MMTRVLDYVVRHRSDFFSERMEPKHWSGGGDQDDVWWSGGDQQMAASEPILTKAVDREGGLGRDPGRTRAFEDGACAPGGGLALGK